MTHTTSWRSQVGSGRPHTLAPTVSPNFPSRMDCLLRHPRPELRKATLFWCVQSKQLLLPVGHILCQGVCWHKPGCQGDCWAWLLQAGLWAKAGVQPALAWRINCGHPRPGGRLGRRTGPQTLSQASFPCLSLVPPRPEDTWLGEVGSGDLLLWGFLHS